MNEWEAIKPEKPKTEVTILYEGKKRVDCRKRAGKTTSAFLAVATWLIKREWAEKMNYKITIEVDGGLSDEVIPQCIRQGAEYLAGWSFFLKYGVDYIGKRIEELLDEKS